MDYQHSSLIFKIIIHLFIMLKAMYIAGILPLFFVDLELADKSAYNLTVLNLKMSVSHRMKPEI